MGSIEQDQQQTQRENQAYDNSSGVESAVDLAKWDKESTWDRLIEDHRERVAPWTGSAHKSASR